MKQPGPTVGVTVAACMNTKHSWKRPSPPCLAVRDGTSSPSKGARHGN